MAAAFKKRRQIACFSAFASFCIVLYLKIESHNVAKYFFFLNIFVLILIFRVKNMAVSLKCRQN